MPNYVDEQLIQMQIDNRQFKKGATEALGILDKLKRALSFKDSNDGFDDLSRKINRVDFSNLLYGVEAISDRFSTLGIVGKRVLENLTDSAYRFAETTVKSLTIDQITGGWTKYGDMTRSIQTIMSATAGDIGTKWADQAEQLSFVNDQLGKLNRFTDETSYNLTDMTNNIGKFTSAGVPLEKAVVDMEGIAAVAGIAGASTQEASRAMYNFSQAIATGTVKLMDWRSIENANMATLEFKQTIIDTAIEIGTLKKDASGAIKTLHGTSVSAENFNTALSEGWFTGDVLEGALHKYGGFADAIVQVADDTDLSVSELLDALEEYHAGSLDFEKWQKELFDTMDEDKVPSIEALKEAMSVLGAEEMELGERAFRASQEARTFSDAIEATKDAVSTGWMTTFQHIFGDYNEAKKLWTGLSEELWDIFASGGKRRNSILKKWHDSGGRDELIDGVKELYYSVRSFIDPIADAWKSIFSLGTEKQAAAKLVSLTKNFKEFAKSLALSEEASNGLKAIFSALFSSASWRNW